jgi:hypothetical protein
MNTIFLAILLLLTTLGIVATSVAIGMAIGAWRLDRQLDAIVREPAVPAASEGPRPEPLTPDEKIDALYKLGKHHGRLQFISILAWAVFGIIGGYLVGLFLPH